MASIYGLFDRAGALRYIGKANDPAKRLASHMRDIGRRRTPLYDWLAKHGLPEMQVLEADCSDWREAERRLISEARARGERLLNIADGGDEPYCSREVRQANGRASRHHPACVAVRSANGRKVAEKMRADPEAMWLKEAMRRLSTAHKQGLLSDFARACMRECFARNPRRFAVWSKV